MADAEGRVALNRFPEKEPVTTKAIWKFKREMTTVWIYYDENCPEMQASNSGNGEICGIVRSGSDHPKGNRPFGAVRRSRSGSDHPKAFLLKEREVLIGRFKLWFSTTKWLL